MNSHSQNFFLKNSKPLIFIAFAIIFGILAYDLAPVVLKSKTRQIQKAIDKIQYSDDTATLDNILLTDGQITEKAYADYLKAYASQKLGSETGLRMALYACKRIDQGFSSSDAQNMLDEQMKNLDLSSGGTDSLPILDDAFKMSGSSVDLVLQRYLETGIAANTDLAEWIGQQYADSRLSFGEIYDVSTKIAEAGLPADAFLSQAILKLKLKNEVLDFIREEDDNDNVTRLAGLFTQYAIDLDSAVLLINIVRKKDLSLKEVFPDGIEIDSFDLQCLNLNYTQESRKFDYPSDLKYLVMSRTEKDEPFKGEETPFDLYNPIGVDYDGNDKNDPSTFIVKIETEWMDRIPAEHFPSENEECNLLIVMDMQYLKAGSIKNTYQIVGDSKYHFIHYPTYYRVYSIAMVERKNNKLEYVFERMATEPESLVKENALTRYLEETLPEDELNSDAYQKIMNTTNYKNHDEALDAIRKVYLAPEDPDWFDNSMEDFLDFLDSVKWNNNFILYMNEYALPEEEL